MQIKKEYTNMKRTLWFLFFLLNSLFYLYADSENDSLLKVLDKVISERLIYTQKKEATIKELKKKKLNKEITDEQYDEQAIEIKGVKTAPVVMIKATDDATYKNLVDALDEMQICSISKYAIVDLTEGDEFLIDNLKQKGALTGQIDESKL